jgi:molybdenum cofactor cytidylyltransferase
MTLTGDIGCRAIFGSHTGNILKVPVDDVGILPDVDTPADLDRFHSANQPSNLAPQLVIA